MVHEDCPAGVIITQGLGGSYRSYIIAQTHLFLGLGSPPLVEVVVEVIRGAGGSFRPETYYPPRRDEEDDTVWEPREDNEFEVVIRARIGSRDIQRHYFVKTRTQVVVAQVLHFVNTTKTRISVVVGAVSKKAKAAAVSIRNLGKKS